MARITYDLYLHDPQNMITITNADTDYFADVSPESFTNPPIRMKFLNMERKDIEKLCLRAINRDELTIDDENVLLMVRGELPGWHLIGANFDACDGLSVFYANEHRKATPPTESNLYDYHLAEGAMFHFLAGEDCLEVEFEVDYADGSPVRCYIGKVVDNDNCYETIVTEYLGKRKIRKFEFSESECSNDYQHGHLCHITEY